MCGKKRKTDRKNSSQKHPNNNNQENTIGNFLENHTLEKKNTHMAMQTLEREEGNEFKAERK